MDLAELSDLIGRSGSVLRVETLDAYSSTSDGDMVAAYLRGDPAPGPDAKQPWLNRLAAAAQRGLPWRRLRVIPRPVPDYVRYACEWGYVDNVRAGEDVRVLDEADPTARTYADEFGRFGDFLILDGVLVAMHYTSAGRFVRADRADESPHISAERAAAIIRRTEEAWAAAERFTPWWAANPDLHRDVPVHR